MSTVTECKKTISALQARISALELENETFISLAERSDKRADNVQRQFDRVLAMYRDLQARALVVGLTNGAANMDVGQCGASQQEEVARLRAELAAQASTIAELNKQCEIHRHAATEPKADGQLRSRNVQLIKLLMKLQDIYILEQSGTYKDDGRKARLLDALRDMIEEGV